MKKFDLNTTWVHATNCYFELGTYNVGGGLYMNIVGTMQGEDIEEPLMDATISCLGLSEGQVAIKSYAENEGLVEELQRLGFVTGIVSTKPCGMSEFHICTVDLSKIKEYSINSQD